MYNSLSLLKVLNGITKSISIAKKILPIYQEVKPFIEKSSKYLNNINNNTKEIKKETTNNNSPKNKPIFFQ